MQDPCSLEQCKHASMYTVMVSVPHEHIHQHAAGALLESAAPWGLSSRVRVDSELTNASNLGWILALESLAAPPCTRATAAVALTSSLRLLPRRAHAPYS